jgi:hypothetical protein
MERPARWAWTRLAPVRSAVHRAGSSMSRTRTRISEAPSTARLAGRYRDLLSRRLPLELLFGAPGTDAVAVVICLWNRPERVIDILRILDGQRSSRPVRLVLWNNSAEHRSHNRTVIDGFRPSGALGSIELFDSPHNVGGVGRFIAARELVRQGYSGPLIMIDDDQDVGGDFVDDLLAASAPRTIAGIWAWNTGTGYWDRTRVTTDGSSASHIGTGGAVCDSSLFVGRRFLTGIPARYLFMEDIWMCQYARRNGWTLRFVDSPVRFVLSERDQGHAIFDRKAEFFQWLTTPRRIPLD